MKQKAKADRLIGNLYLLWA